MSEYSCYYQMSFLLSLLHCLGLIFALSMFSFCVEKEGLMTVYEALMSDMKI